MVGVQGWLEAVQRRGPGWLRWRVWRVGLVGLIAGFALLLPVQAAEPTAQPLLRLETGTHTAPIRRIATDRAGRWAVTASGDKTARIWEVASGRLVGVLRPPQDEGNEGKLYAVALSPDGETVALGGHTGWDWEGKASIYLFDRSSQQLRRRITGLPNVIFHLAWSPDGRWLAASLGGANGVRVFDARSGAEVGRDTEFKSDSYSVEFSPSAGAGGASGPRLLSSSWDGHLRLHAVEANGALRLMKAVRPGGGERPYAARFSPDGRQVAVGFDDSRVVQVLDAAGLHEIARPDVTGVDNGDLSKLAWSADGRSLVAAGRWWAEWKRSMRRWSTGDWGRLGDTPLANNTVMDLVALPSSAGGGWLFAAQDPAWGVLGSDGQVLRRQDPVLADLRGHRDQLLVSSDGMAVRFGFAAWGKLPHRFDAGQRLLGEEGAGTWPALQPARIQAADLTVKEWINSTAPTLNGQPLKLEPYETSRSLAITPDGQRFVLGADWQLRLFDRQGQPVWERPVPGVAWAVNVSADGRWVVAGYADGTIRWHQLSDGKEVLAFFPHANRQDWVLWTPEGFYAASPGAEGLIGFHLNQGRDREGEFISAAQLADKFYRPGLVSARLGPDGDRLMAQAVKEHGNVEDLLRYARNVPPELTLAPLAGVLEGETEVSFTATLTDRGGGIGPVTILVNGQPVEGRQSGVGQGRSITRTFTVPLAPGRHQVQLAPQSLAGVAGKPTEPITALLQGAAPGSTLHVLAVGVGAYQDPTLRLAHSGRDAEVLAADLARLARPVFQRVAPPRVLKDEQASLAGIEATFAELRQQMKPQDTLVIFLAGHGETRNDAYTFLPWDFRRGASGPAGEGLDEKRLFAMLRQSPPRTLLLLDTCESGSLVDIFAATERINQRQQRAVIGASRRGELAQAGYQGHGVFTAALLQVLGRNDGEELTPMELLPQVRRAVARISQSLGGAYRQQVLGIVDKAEFPLVKR